MPFDFETLQEFFWTKIRPNLVENFLSNNLDMIQSLYYSSIIIFCSLFFSVQQKEEDITCLLMDSCHVQLSHLLTSIFSPK